jgi:hypothetical protein
MLEGRAVNADLMITIAFCLMVVFGSFAGGVLFALSVRDDRAKEAEAKRLAAGDEPPAALKQPRSTRAADESDARALRAGEGDRGRGEKRSRAARSCEHRREVKGPDAQGCWTRSPEFTGPRLVRARTRA